MNKIDLNCDLGESFGAYRIGMDEQVIPLITSANVACGFHAGDPVIMEKTVALCKKYGVNVGAHPGFPDLNGFGRRNMTLSRDEVRASIIYQVAALRGFCEAAGVALHHVKPHGALYNMAAVDRRLADAICEGVRAVDPSLSLMALCGSEMVSAAQEAGLGVLREAFADRAYMPDGTLSPRSMPGAVLTDEAAAIAQVRSMAERNCVTAIDGTVIEIHADTICLHGDNEKAVTFARAIRAAIYCE